MVEKKCSAGEFVGNGAYKITDVDTAGNWEYIYQNRDILVRVDQKGLVSSQALPPKDIMLFKRESSDRFSKLITWVKNKKTGKIVSNFGFPKTERAENSSVTYSAVSAVYFYDYGDFSVQTEVFTPKCGTTLVLEVKVTNTSGAAAEFEIMPTMYPYINEAQLCPWDKSEWYLSTTARKTDSGVEFITHLANPGGDKTKRRMVTYATSCGESVELSLEKFEGVGSFDMPDAIAADSLSYKTSELDGIVMNGYAPVYATKQVVTLRRGEQMSFIQTLNMQSVENCGEFSESESAAARKYLDKPYLEQAKAEQEEFYAALFAKREIKSDDSALDNYVNSFLPLQMYWVASLDRGWPTGMRGVRDASNDFMGMLMLDESWTRKTIVELVSCQRRDGWFPRQISANGRGGKHDLRNYVDGGVFALELMTAYFNYTADDELFAEKFPWLDCNDEDSVARHYLRAIEFYLDKKNIGEHGLIKLYEGDWLDAVNRAGVKGRGESVTVTSQVVMALYAAMDMPERIFGEDAGGLRAKFACAADSFKKNLMNAYNSSGFFNSVFNDDGKWIFSNSDADGKSRMYAPANYYAILAGATNKEMCDKIWDNAEKTLRSDNGYRLFYPPLGNPPMENVGRIASGDMPFGLWENGNVYNHGSQGFRARALAKCGMGDKLAETIELMLPCSSAHKIEKTKSAPYAVVNCYQSILLENGRGGMPFLTGTIAMIMRAVYEWQKGIVPTYDGLILRPCLPMGKTDCAIKFVLRNKRYTIVYSGENKGQKPIITVNGAINSEKKTLSDGEVNDFVPDTQVSEYNIVLLYK